MIIACNWKMNMNSTAAHDLISAMISCGISCGISDGLSAKGGNHVQRIVFPPFPLLSAVHSVASASDIAVGGQDCHRESGGAFTGDVSAAMLSDAGCQWVILGHSERRQHHHEDDHLIAQKVMAAQSAGLSVILCVGETADARSSGMADTIVLDMLKSSLSDDVDLTRLAIAYEPVWAIGTGQTASQADILDMHMAIKGFLRSIAAAHLAVLYGGSVRADNAASIMAIDGVDGLLIGGASLNAESINAITEAAVQT